MSKMRGRFLGRVLISRAMVAGFVAGGISIWLLMPMVYFIAAIPMAGFESAWSDAWNQVNYLHVGYAVIGGMAYGLFRATLFHPLIHRQYGAWLAQTPWRYPKALPLGPLRLIAQDAVVVGVMMLIAALPPAEWRHINLVPIAFLACHSAGLSWAHLRRKSRWPLAVWVFLTGVVILSIQLPLVSLGIAFLLTSAIHQVIGLSLRDFPYLEEERRTLKLLPIKEPERVELRWFAAPAALQKWRYDMKRIDAVLIGAAIGWAIYCVMFHNKDRDRDAMLMLLHGYLTVFLLLSRCWAYIAGHWPPLSLAGRLATGRLIIPAYDVVFVTPTLAIIATLMLPKVLVGIGVIPFIAWPLTTAATTAILLGGPPSYETWHFTGHFRETAGNADKRKFLQA